MLIALLVNNSFLERPFGISSGYEGATLELW